MTDNVPTGRELEALKVLWMRGKATVREIYQEMKLCDGEGGLAYTTVLSLLQTMEQKGLVGHESAGKAYVYCPLVQRESTFRKLAGGFLDQVFDGALGEYVCASPAVTASFAQGTRRAGADDRRGQEESSRQRTRPQ